MNPQNKNVVLIMGKPNSGKSSSLRNLDHSKMCYLNADLKEIPFKSNFAASIEVEDAVDILGFIDEVENTEEVSGAVLDTITFLMSMYERQYVTNAANGQKAWGAYGTFYRDVIHKIKSGSKNYAVMAHEETIFNEQDGLMETRVPIKGAVGKVGVEADFSIVLSAAQMPVKTLLKYPNSLLNITEEEQEDGVKYVFCTRITKETVGSKIRSPIGLWGRDELYIDNDLQLVFNRLNEYYN